MTLYAHNAGKEFPATGFFSISLMKWDLDSAEHLNSTFDTQVCNFCSYSCVRVVGFFHTGLKWAENLVGFQTGCSGLLFGEVPCLEEGQSRTAHPFNLNGMAS